MEQNQTLLDHQNETTQTEPPSASEPIEQKNGTKQKKKLTREQRWWRFHGMQAGLFLAMGIIGGGILIALACLLTLPLRGTLNQPETPTQETETSIQEPVVVTPTPTPPPPGFHRIPHGSGRQPDSQHSL